MKLGFLGAGLMSAPMIENLLADGHEVRVWNRTAAKAAALSEAGAVAVEQAADTCTPGGVVFSCLADDAALDAVFADGRVLATLGEGGVHASMSTISGSCAERLEGSHRAAGVAYLAAPVLGRPDAVKARMQSYLLAGDPQAAARISGVLAALGRKVFEFGPDAAAANVAKINFNFLIAAAVEAMAEAFSVVEKSGLDPRQFYELVTGTAFACPLYSSYGAILVDKGWDSAAFKLTLGLKDVRLAQTTAAAAGARMQLGELLEQRFEGAIANGHGDKDWTAIALDIRAEAGLDVEASKQ